MSVLEDEAQLDALLDVIYQQYHYDFRGYARASLRRRVTAAMARLHADSIADVKHRIATDRHAFTDLLPWFTVQLSDLFRDPAYFRFFREQVVPVLRTYPSRKLWVAGCSTGEEAYSFAIILREEQLLDRTLIYATDIFEQSLRTAESGIYDLDRMRTFTENHRLAGGTTSLSEHYTTGPQGAMFDKGLRDHIVFADHSLATDEVFAEVHVVSCRNVLIYFATELQNRALGLFHGALVRGGWLGLGPKETIEFSTEKDRFSPHPERWFHKREARAMIAIVIGGSAGSLDALHALFSALKSVTEATFIVVLHLSPSSKSLLPEVLGAYTGMPVREAVDKLPLISGTVVVAPPDYHLLIERDLTFGLSRDAAVHYSRPAIDPLFETAADVFGPNAIGVLLSGANDDGAAGLRTIQTRGGRVAVQDPATASATEMPLAGLAACRPDLVATPRAIGLWLTSLLGGVA